MKIQSGAKPELNMTFCILSGKRGGAASCLPCKKGAQAVTSLFCLESYLWNHILDPPSKRFYDGTGYQS